MGDSVWCGGAALAAVLLMDGIALLKGGRHEVPAAAMWVAVAGIVLPVLNLFFVLRDAVKGRRKQALVGLALSVAAWAAVFYPPWARYVRTAETQAPMGVTSAPWTGSPAASSP